MSVIIEFDPTLFRALFPAYEDPIKYPDVFLQQFWDQAICYVDDEVGCIVTASCRQQLINLMTAHLLQIWDIVNKRTGTEVSTAETLWDDTAMVLSSTIKDTSVTMMAPPVSGSQFEWWVNQTPYGKQFSALLSITFAAGVYVPGIPARRTASIAFSNGTII